jgi:hypothetical protein
MRLIPASSFTASCGVAGVPSFLFFQASSNAPVETVPTTSVFIDFRLSIIYFFSFEL